MFYHEIHGFQELVFDSIKERIVYEKLWTEYQKSLKCFLYNDGGAAGMVCVAGMGWYR